MTAASPSAEQRPRRRQRRAWPPVLILSALALVALAALPLRNGGPDTAVRIGPTSALLPPTPVVIGEAPPAAVEPGTYQASGISFRVNREQTGMEDVRVTTECGPARAAAVTIAADGAFGASAASAQTRITIKGRFVQPDVAHGVATVQAGGCSDTVAFSARLRT